MTVSIFKVLAALPSGKYAEPLKADEASVYLSKHYNTLEEQQRNKAHAMRDAFYRDGGDQEMVRVINDVFQDPTVRDLRKKWVPYSKFNNAIKRIVNEQSTVYSEPARRFVGKSKPEVADDSEIPDPTTTDDDRYQELLEAIRMDERAVEIDRLLSLHRALLVGFRVRQNADGTREPVLDIVTPANARAVMHPNDNTKVIGWLIRSCYKPAVAVTETPEWTLWTDHESVQLTSGFRFIEGSYQEHQIGVCPWVPVTLGPTGPGFWPGNEGEDLVAAHVAIWFNNLLLLKESKSATKQTIIQGDGTAMARGQALDTETPAELADGQSATTVDMSMDLSMFRDTTDHVLFNTSYNYGMSPAIMTHQGVQSAQARELMRIPLKEIRRQRQVPLRRFELEYVLVMAAVVRVDLPEFAFDPTGWRIEFAESETPLDPMQEMQLFERMRAAGLTNTVEFLQKKYPGLTHEDALAIIKANVLIELERIREMKPLMQISGSMDMAIEETAAGVHVSAMPGAAPTPSGLPSTRGDTPNPMAQPPAA